MKKQPPPSKKKYDMKHPVVSVRVNAKLKEKLDEIRAMTSKSIADILKEYTGKHWVNYDKAYNKGFNFAASLYAIEYKCSVCGETMTIGIGEEKRAAAKFMEEQGWHHVECP